jgi:hypothetical protein
MCMTYCGTFFGNLASMYSACIQVAALSSRRV